jgi:hypothetical protein
MKSINGLKTGGERCSTALKRKLSGGFNFNVDRQQGQFPAAFRAVTIILMQNLVRRLKLRALIQYMMAFMANNTLRQPATHSF